VTADKPASRWRAIKPWVKRIGGAIITVAIFAFLLRPIVRDWEQVKAQVASIDAWRFVLAVLLCAASLLLRAVTWQKILAGLGRRLPVAPVVRIWSLGELARYLPGTIWQFVGRVVLLRPYGVDGAICTTSQVLELSTFVLANVSVATITLLWFASTIEGHARLWLFVAAALVPVLAIVIHPAVYYRLVNAALVRAKRQPLTERLSGAGMVALLAAMVVVLLLQSAGVFLLVQPALHLRLEWLWIVAAAYSLAWTAGFLAFWAPGGLGVRELVFVAAMSVVLPEDVRRQFPEPTALLGFLAVMLRVWATAGELLVCAGAHAADYEGMLGRRDAPGRVADERP
jgi:uncharacterized membrane protein YbhN (UPF0104 family)